MTDFPSLAFQSSLGTEAILFGVFGFLYSVFFTSVSQVTSANPQLPPLAKKLSEACRIVAVLAFVNAGICICSLLFMYLYSRDISGVGNIVLAVLFALTMLTIAGICIVWAFWYMD